MPTICRIAGAATAYRLPCDRTLVLAHPDVWRRLWWNRTGSRPARAIAYQGRPHRVSTCGHASANAASCDGRAVADRACRRHRSSGTWAGLPSRVAAWNRRPWRSATGSMRIRRPSRTDVHGMQHPSKQRAGSRTARRKPLVVRRCTVVAVRRRPAFRLSRSLTGEYRMSGFGMAPAASP